MNAAALAAQLGKARREGSEWRCLCPAHADHDPSLSVTDKDGQILVICRAGCDQATVIDALKARGLWELPERDDPPPGGLNIVATYDYVDTDGKLIFQVVRLYPKDFRQRRKVGPDWVWNLNGVTRVPYHLDELAQARKTANGHPWRCYIAEGEKAADRLRQWNLTVSTNPGGAGKWRPEYNQYFTGCEAVILPDNDIPGLKHAQQVAAALGPVAAVVKILTLTGLPPKGDIEDWIGQGGTQSILEDLVDNTPPLAQPTPPSSNGWFTGRQFVDSYCAPSWLVPGILQRGRLYACTSLTGHGKTAVWLYNACMIQAGRSIAGLNAKQGNVLVLAGENPEDLKARMLGMCAAFNLSPNQLPFVIPKTFPLTEEEASQLIAEITARQTPLSLIILDTAASFFPGDDENSNVQAGTYGRTLRSLAQLPGNPTILALSHPTKNASRDNLLPRGGGAFLNELDGNLTLWADQPGENSTLHWHGKIRGADFNPIPYRLKSAPTGHTDEDNIDITTIVAQPIDDFEAADRALQATVNEDAVLQTLNNNPHASWADIARICGWTDNTGQPERWRVQRALNNLAADRLVKKFRRKWILTDAGKNALKGQQC